MPFSHRYAVRGKDAVESRNIAGRNPEVVKIKVRIPRGSVKIERKKENCAEDEPNSEVMHADMISFEIEAEYMEPGDVIKLQDMLDQVVGEFAPLVEKEISRLQKIQALKQLIVVE